MRRRLTAFELKKILDQVPDEALIVCPVSDHGYSSAEARQLCEDFGDAGPPLERNEKRINVVVIQ